MFSRPHGISVRLGARVVRFNRNREILVRTFGLFGLNVASLVFAIVLAFAFPSSAQAQDISDPSIPTERPSILTDKSDYSPGETAQISGSGFHPNEIVTIRVTHETGGSADGRGHEPFTVSADSSG